MAVVFDRGLKCPLFFLLFWGGTGLPGSLRPDVEMPSFVPKVSTLFEDIVERVVPSKSKGGCTLL